MSDKFDKIHEDLGTLKERTNHLTTDVTGIKKDVMGIKKDVKETKEDITFLKEKANKRFLGLSNKEIVLAVGSIPTLVTLLQILFKQLGWL